GLLWPLALWRQPRIIRTDRPLATILGTDAAGALYLAAVVLAAFAAFALAVWLAQGMSGRRPFLTVLCGAAVFSLILLPIYPAAANDVYHNVADARTLWLYGDNPIAIPPIVHAADPFYRNVIAWQTTPSIYGPLWYLLSGAPLPFAGDALWSNVIGQKAITAVFLVSTTALVMLTAARIQPRAAVAAGVLVGWNPLLQFETAGNAHNGIVMVFFATAALYAITRRWWLAVFPLLALAVASKYVLGILGPVLLVWMWRRQDIPRRQIIASLLLGAVVGLALYLPFLSDDPQRNFLRESSFASFSPSAVLHTVLYTRFGLNGLQALNLVKLIFIPAFLAGYGYLLYRIPRDAQGEDLARVSFWCVFLLLIFLTAWFGPWYLVFLVPLGALLAGSRPAQIAAVFSATAMLMYVPYFWLLHGDRVILQAATAGTAFLLPMLLACWHLRSLLTRRTRSPALARIPRARPQP
ncbi:MAG: hypothetical protein ACRDJE_06095, partial [Dehalococcoidia bacterium]